AKELTGKGVKNDSLIGLMMERSIEMIVALLGIMKGRGAYLPVDPGYPRERIDFMLRDSGAEIIVTNNLMVKRLNGSREQTDKPTNLAYIIYTSGSTGKPKGVLIQHHSAVYLVFNQKKRFNIDKTDRILQFSSITFDASVEQIFITFSSGAVLVMIDKETLLDIAHFEQFIAKQSITHLHAVPSFLNNVHFRDTYSLRRIITGADVCPVSLARRFSKYPHCDFYNKYGPTETTVTSIEMKVDAVDDDLHRVPIGKPIGNTVVYVLDKWLNLAPVGVVGELYIGGVGVARGYLNQPELTVERFVYIKDFSHGRTRTNTDKTNTDKHIYKTGDLTRWLVNGNIEFLGRVDSQVKIRG
ncbi:MAG: amino acid adenylation domain-containing protein, partial [bacterium]|nr:amino acid adenylation domain-containing protein [bacterium]